jgi:hypothetical protein
MEKKSHIDVNKLNHIPQGAIFGYRDVVEDQYPNEEHTEDGKRFKQEVEDGLFSQVVIDEETDSRQLYKKK